MRSHAFGDVAEVALVGDVQDGATIFGLVVLFLQGKGPFLEAEVRGLFFSAG